MSKAEFTRKSEQIRQLLEAEATKLGQQSGFVRRQSKLTASLFVETLVLGLQERPRASLNELVQVSAGLGVAISEQGLQARINEAGVQLLAGLLGQALEQLQNKVRLPGAVLRQFKAVYVLDSSIVTLPTAMQQAFAGFASPGSEAALKFQLAYEYLSGNLAALELQAGRLSDQSCTLAVRLAQPGSLHLEDLGYFDQDDLAAIDGVGAFFVSRLKYGTHVYAQASDEVPLDLLAVLRRQPNGHYEQTLYLGARQHLAVRLVGQRLPAPIVAQRRRKALAAARKKGHTCSQAYLEWLSWNLFITNTTMQQLSSEQLLLIYSLRWQIELIFKVWKSQASLACTGSYRAERVLCTLYARLIGLVIFHWLVAPYRVVKGFELSLPKAFHVLQRRVARLLDSIVTGWTTTPAVLQALADALFRFAAKDARRAKPSSYRRLVSRLP